MTHASAPCETLVVWSSNATTVMIIVLDFSNGSHVGNVLFEERELFLIGTTHVEICIGTIIYTIKVKFQF